jgi:hypothetical protein
MRASSLDRVYLVPTAVSWAVRSGLAASAGAAVSKASDPKRASEDRHVVGCFRGLTFRFLL